MNNGTTNWSCDTCGEVLNSVKARGHKCRDEIVMRGGIKGKMIGKVQKENFEKLHRGHPGDFIVVFPDEKKYPSIPRKDWGSK